MDRNCLSRRKAAHSGERGYVLLTLLLALALMIIFAAAIVPTIKFQIEHDREDELIHRGVQYSRAIRAYYKKFGRYPVKLEDLESSNNQRFLRKRYKDPITNQDFKLLHFGEVKLVFSGGGLQPGVNGLSSPSGLSGTPGLGQQSAFGNSAFGGQSSSAFGSNSAFGGNSSFGNSNSSFGSNSQTGNQPGSDASSSQSSTSSGTSQDATGGTSSNATGGGSNGNNGNNGSSGDQLSGQVFGGAAIVGVVSTSKKEGYHEFNHKKKYSEWQFVYDPGTDRGGLLMTPNQPPLMPTAVPGQNAGAPINNNGGFGQPGNSSGNGFGNGSSFGSSPSQNNQNSGFGNSNSPPNNQQQ